MPESREGMNVETQLQQWSCLRCYEVIEAYSELGPTYREWRSMWRAAGAAVDDVNEKRSRQYCTVIISSDSDVVIRS